MANSSRLAAMLAGVDLDALAEAFADALAERVVDKLAARAEHRAAYYDQHRNPFGTEGHASRRFREFVNRHAARLEPFRDGKLVMVDAVRFDALLAELRARPLAVAPSSAPTSPAADPDDALFESAGLVSPKRARRA